MSTAPEPARVEVSGLTSTGAQVVWAALERHRDRLRGNGVQQLPPDVVQLLALVQLRAIAGQEVPTGDVDGESAKAGHQRELLRYGEAAEVLGISLRGLKRRIAEGVVPVVRIGPRTCRIAISDLDDLRSRRGVA